MGLLISSGLSASGLSAMRRKMDATAGGIANATALEAARQMAQRARNIQRSPQHES